MPRFALAVGLATTCLLACRYPATQVYVVLDTDAPARRALHVQITARPGMATSGAGMMQSFVHGGTDTTHPLPGTFTVAPGNAAADSFVTVVLDADLEAGGASEPAVSFRRIVRFRFTPRTATRVPLFLAMVCGNPASGCTTPGIACTIAQRCEELGQTCGDHGECVNTEVMTEPVPDAGALADVTARDLGTDVGMDVPTVDAVDTIDTLDAPDGVDVTDIVDVPPDTGPPNVIRVTNTMLSGPGSLPDAIAYVNTNCAMLPTPFTIAFDIPNTDPGYVDTGRGNHVWRIPTFSPATLSCGVTLDGTTQTDARGNTNPTHFGGMPVGMAGVPLPFVEGPEIELRGLDLLLTAPGITVRGVAMRTLNATPTASPMTVEHCLIDSEPDQLTPYPSPAPNNTVLYIDSHTGSIIRGNAFVWQVGVSNNYNGITANSSANLLIEDNYFTGVGGAGLWDEVHLNTAINHTVQHNYFSGTSWEWHIEWVTGTGGVVSENTFTASVPMISMGGAATMSGNATVP